MSSTTPCKIYSPSQLHSQLDEIRHLLNVAYFAMDTAKGNEMRLESGLYTIGLVASKLDDLTFHYERIVREQAGRGVQP
ncbi:hypothetical protein VSS37_13420 [Candidatus Thiothrix sp. Deng01]|uniref:Cell division protein ZapA n=1 Tax=Candidatus Thiothrix phosphatis TaxID=3112415 RepID=A0ABU6CYS2_9GAMM|nr:hypothetical protein [Candidatus Thiothrix sp. Deng01]MEB4591987.1 hypothetical protein [Candidatus Thiothrix sp. Deng01]